MLLGSNLFLREDSEGFGIVKNPPDEKRMGVKEVCFRDVIF